MPDPNEAPKLKRTCVNVPENASCKSDGTLKV